MQFDTVDTVPIWYSLVLKKSELFKTWYAKLDFW